MIAYSDIIIQKKNSPVIKFEIKKKCYLGSLLKIKYRNETIYQNKLTNLIQEIDLNLIPDKDYVELLVEIESDVNSIKFPVSILVLNPDEPYIICDIDFTVSSTNFLLFLTKNLLHIKTLQYSAEVLKKLSKHYKIIYLTGRFESYTKLTKLWLRKNLFPRGPLISRKFETSFQLEAFKCNALKNIVKISKKGIGIGDLKSDISAYLTHNLIAIKINRLPFFNKKSSSYKYNKNYYQVMSWKGIEKLFKDNSFY